MLEHELGKPEEHFLARLGCLLRPAAAAECRARAGHGALDVTLATGRHGSQRTPGRRIDVVEGRAVRGWRESSLDEHLRTRRDCRGAFAPLRSGNGDFSGHGIACQNVGGVEAEMISQTSLPTLRKRCGVELEK